LDEPGSLVKERVMAKIGRNDPCPCGSGQKYKRCCQHQPVMPPADFLWRQLRTVDDHLTQQLLKHAKRLSLNF
jgi:SEC-C motif